MLALANKLSITTQPIYRFVNKYSIDFDGVDDRIITDGADTVIQDTTYSFWAKSSTTGNNKGVFGHGGTNIGGFHFNYTSNRPMLYLSTNNYIFWNDTSAQDDGEWHHWVVYADTTNINNCKLYCDGILQTVNQTFGTPITPYTEPLTIGSDKQVGGNSFEGQIDEFAVYDRELTQAEITRMFNTYYSPNRVANGNFSQIGNEEVTNGDFSQIGSEEITNGDFATDLSGWSISGNSDADHTVTWTSQGARYQSTTTSPTLLFFQNSLTSGKIYKFTVDIAYTSGTIKLQTGSGASLFNPTLVEGTNTFYFTASSVQFLFIRSTTNVDVLIDNVSVKEVGQGYTWGTGWSIDGTKATTDGTDTDVSGWLRQFNVLTAGKSYKATFDVDTSDSGTVLQVVDGYVNIEAITGSGSKTIYFKAQGSEFSFGQLNGKSASVTNISVKEVGQHWTFGTGWSTDGTKATSDGTATNLTQNLSFNTNATYKVMFDITDYTSGAVRITLNDVNTADVNAVGSYSYDLTIGSSITTGKILIDPRSNFVGSIDNIVVQELKHDATNLMLNAGAYQSANPLITSTKSMEFDGVDDYLQLSEPFNYTNHTICAWVKPNNFDTGQIIFSSLDSSSDGIQIKIQTNGKIRYRVNANIKDAANAIELNKWTLLVCSYDGSTMSIYLDGQFSSDKSATETVSTTTNVRIGNSSYATGTGSVFDGKITEVGAFNRCLTALEVASLYNQGMPTNLLVNRNNYQSGNPTVFNTKQVDFDGSDDYLKANSTLGSFTGSISAWVKRDTVNNWSYVVDFRTNSGGGYLNISPTGIIDTGGSSVKYVDNVVTSQVPQDTEWHHIVITNLSINITECILIGARYSLTEELNGKLSQVGLWNSTLTADEVSSLYNHGLPIDLTTDQAAYASSANLVGYWRMGSGTLDTYPLIADQTNATLGSELVTNGDFATDTGWTKGTGVTISNGVATSDGTSGNYDNILVGTISGTWNTSLYYEVSVEVKSYTSGSFKLNNSTHNITDAISSAGTHTVFWSPTTANSVIGVQNFGTPFNGTIDNITVKQVNGNPAIMTNQTSSDIENGSPYANIVQNGTFDTDSDWTKGTGWTIANGKANKTSGVVSYVQQNLIITANITYKVVFEVSNYTSGNVKYGFTMPSSSHFGTPQTSNGTYTEYFTPNENTFVLRFRASDDFVGSIDNVTVEEVNTGLQGYWKMGDGTNDEYPVIYDQVDPTLSAELITNGDFATDSDWDTGTGITIGSGVALFTSVSSGLQLAQLSISGVIGKTYKISYEIKSITEGAFSASIGTTLSSNQNNAVGVYTEYLTATSTNAFYIRSRGTTSGSIDNVSLKEVQGNPAVMTNMVEGNITNQFPLTKIRNYYRMGDGILDGYPIIQDQTSPNLAHIPTTNLLRYSEDFSNAAWVKSLITFTSNYAIAPDGTQTADRLVSSGGSYPQFYTTLTGLTIGQVYTVSFYVKSDGTTQIEQSAHISGISPTITFTPTNDWVRIEYTRTATATSHSFVIFTASGSAAACSYLIWGYQVEEQSQATAYIKSDGIAAVRKASTTNLITYSEDFSQSVWNKQNISITPNYSTSPFGTNNATRFLTTSNVASFLQVLSLSILNSTSYTISVYAKSNNGLNKFRFYTSTAGTSSEFTTTSDWQRFEYNITSTGTSSNIGLRGVSGSETDIIIFGFQIEQQTQAETYAKTTGLPVTIDLFTQNSYGTMTNMSSSDIVEDTP